ncbi:hypothetical protein M427DRAFT_154439 [Gonapodya prolifera JEL478]|uniref:RTA1-domain-containing protein n=1 Tax=Gonapodya prolifera (strain JEL478) TaxID=1344416 RepID=A0A139AI72_GONPJ|nr:hypothetical protein M427DRAFT_154439 [Gonapodya prolifera JEL478]|eukprot:KXS16516.1 hypothetical protein M427DRAFT_154439 [Gonapodya prolifera JEL478]
MAANTLPWEQTVFRYEPSTVLAVVFLSLFALASIAHAVQLYRRRQWFMTTILIGCLLEVLGFALRLKAKEIAQEISRNTKIYSGQFACIVIAPIFFAAGVYILLSRMVTFVGTQYCPLPPRRIAQIFITADILAFLVQIAGTFILLSAEQNYSQFDVGLKVLIAGLAVQVLAILFYLVLAIRVYVKAYHVKGPWHRLMWSNLVCSGFILIRNTFRVIELWEGFESPIAKTEALVYVLDAGMMWVVAVVFLGVDPADRLVKEGERGSGDGESEGESAETAELRRNKA